MVVLNRLFAAAAALGTVYAMPAVDVTLKARVLDGFTCGSDKVTVAGMPSANETLIAQSAGVMAEGDNMIEVRWSVISKDGTVQGGNIPDSTISSSIDVLNREFGGKGFVFRAVNTDRKVNPDWYQYADIDSNTGRDNSYAQQMKETTRGGGPATLNIWSTGLVNSVAAGYATFPWWYNQTPQLDGVVIQFNTLPGGTLTGYNTGKILVHEVGHWLGLFHTFQDGCYGGDYVDDTPAEASAASGCPTGRDTCAQPGADPIWNHMDYSNDACRVTFTNGQVSRMRSVSMMYRGTR